MQDLANLVRRRGYKLIKEILAASQEVKVNDFNVDESLTDNQENTNTEEDESTGVFFFFSLFTAWDKVKLKTLLIKSFVLKRFGWEWNKVGWSCVVVEWRDFH